MYTVCRRAHPHTVSTSSQQPSGGSLSADVGYTPNKNITKPTDKQTNTRKSKNYADQYSTLNILEWQWDGHCVVHIGCSYRPPYRSLFFVVCCVFIIDFRYLLLRFTLYLCYGRVLFTRRQRVGVRVQDD